MSYVLKMFLTFSSAVLFLRTDPEIIIINWGKDLVQRMFIRMWPAMGNVGNNLSVQDQGNEAVLPKVMLKIFYLMTGKGLHSTFKRSLMQKEYISL